MSVLHTEEALLPVRHSPDSGDCGLVPWKEWPAMGLLFLPHSCWGVEPAWDELCAFLFLVRPGCKPEHLSLSFGIHA